MVSTFRFHPPLVLASGFLILIVVGTFVLKLPGFTHTPISWLQSAFMATSAVTVTGLTVVELSQFTIAGQITIALLVEAGGLGFMMFAVIAFMALERKMGMFGQLVASEAMGGIKLSDVNKMTRAVILMALTVQACGWLVLFLGWLRDLGFFKAAYYAFFYTISAFNNAGFGLTNANLMPYQHNMIVVLGVSALIIIGGLGFFVVTDIVTARHYRKLKINTRLILLATLIINLGAFVVIWLLERHNVNTLGSLPLQEQFTNAWFQAVTPRTAGFNTVPVDQLTDGTTLLTMCLMFIGGGSFSTASGLKLGTFLVLFFTTLSYLRQRDRVTIMKRAVPERLVKKAIALLCITVTLIILSIFILAVIEEHHEFVDVLFEVVSALSTVGLSRGITGSLTPLGEGVLMFMMFAGRIGPLTIGYMIALPKKTKIQYPESQLDVG